MTSLRVVGPPPLSPEQQQLVTSVLPLIEAKVSELVPRARAEERDELVAWARHGAVVAATRYDAAMGTRFSSYAYPYICGEILDCVHRERRHRGLLRAASWTARTFVAETSDRFDVIWDDEATNTGRIFTYASRLVAAMSLRVARPSSGSDDTPAELLDRCGAIEVVRDALAGMTDEKRRLYELRYVEELPIHKVAAGLGVSVSTARRRHEELLDDIAAAFRARDMDAMAGLG